MIISPTGSSNFRKLSHDLKKLHRAAPDELPGAKISIRSIAACFQFSPHMIIIANDKVIFTLRVCCAGFALHKQHISFANPCASSRSVYSERQNIFDVHYKGQHN